jgi:hypothetical protein
LRAESSGESSRELRVESAEFKPMKHRNLQDRTRKFALSIIKLPNNFNVTTPRERLGNNS